MFQNGGSLQRCILNWEVQLNDYVNRWTKTISKEKTKTTEARYGVGWK